MAKPSEVEQLISNMASAITEAIASLPKDNIVMIGIHTGGAWVAKQLHQLVELEQPLASLDISFYRDDFSRIGMHPQVKPSNLPASVENMHIILVDDVLHTGRTIRAAMNEIFDYGRPASILLATLAERSGRELPVQPDIVGKHISLKAHEHVKLTGPDDLQLVVSSDNNT